MNENPYLAFDGEAVMEQREARRVAISRIPFGSFIVLCGIMGASFGLIIGLGTLSISPFGVLDFRLDDDMVGFEFKGIAAGAIYLLAFPPYFAVICTVLSIPGYLPFCLLLRFARNWLALSVMTDDADSTSLTAVGLDEPRDVDAT